MFSRRVALGNTGRLESNVLNPRPTSRFGWMLFSNALANLGEKKTVLPTYATQVLGMIGAPRAARKSGERSVEVQRGYSIVNRLCRRRYLSVQVMLGFQKRSNLHSLTYTLVTINSNLVKINQVTS